MRYWCSRKHDWEGVLTNDKMKEKASSDKAPTVETQDQTTEES
jgi:hypothetical protein